MAFRWKERDSFALWGLWQAGSSSYETQLDSAQRGGATWTWNSAIPSARTCGKWARLRTCQDAGEGQRCRHIFAHTCAYETLELEYCVFGGVFSIGWILNIGGVHCIGRIVCIFRDLNRIRYCQGVSFVTLDQGCRIDFTPSHWFLHSVFNEVQKVVLEVGYISLLSKCAKHVSLSIIFGFFDAPWLPRDY